MVTPVAVARYPISAHLEPLATSTPVAGEPYSHRIHPLLGSRGDTEAQTQRQKIVKEIFDTEHSYISQLTTISTLFLEPIRLGCLLPADTCNTIFCSIEGILSVNLELFSSMRQHSLGEAFSCLGPFLKLYSSYANNFSTANETLQECLRHYPDFAHFVSSQEARPECRGLNLAALLVTPIQRIPRYKLLLEDLLRHTKTTHQDYSKLSAASAQIAAVASHINEHIRQHDYFKRMLAIQNSLTGPCVPGILAPGRQYIREGRLMKVCRRRAKERVVFLFSDIFIYAQPRTLECRCVLPLLSSSVSVVGGHSRAPGVKVLFRVGNENTSLLFFSYKPEEVHQWAEDIERAIRGIQDAFGSLMNSQHAPLYSSPLSHSTALPSPPPVSPYPMTATLISSHSMEDIPSSYQRSSDHHQQPATLREYHGGRKEEEEEEEEEERVQGGQSTATVGSRSSGGSSGSETGGVAMMEQLPQSPPHSPTPHPLSGVRREGVGETTPHGSGPGGGAGKRLVRRGKGKLTSVSEEEETLVLRNVHTLGEGEEEEGGGNGPENEEEEEEVFIQDESTPIHRAIVQRNTSYQAALSPGSLSTVYSDIQTVRHSQCCAIL